MVTRALAIVALLASGCFEDRYTCKTDLDCDLGSGGVCEANHFCTSHDVSCETGRRYQIHAGELSSTCYDDRVVPSNPCAGGQGPAPRTDACFARVCDRLPACCDVGWSDACVPIVQQECDVVCDTRIAITATRGTTTELWNAVWNGTDWVTTPEMELSSPFQWVGPAAGTSEPRRVGTAGGQLHIGAQTVDITDERVYQSVSSVYFDRHDLETLALAYTYPAGDSHIDLWTPAADTLRTTEVSQTQLVTWGDQDRDGFPDAVAKSGANYGLLENLAAADFSRQLSSAATASVSGGATNGAPAIRAMDWLDLNGDTLLDLAVFGSSVRIHTRADRLADTPEQELDCIPPSTARSCISDPEPNLESASFGGTAFPDRDEPSVIISAFPGRKLYRARQQGDAVISTPLAFPGDTCSCVANCTQCPGASCSCTYDCTMCSSVLALTARDLDGDHRLDLVAIDSRLQIYTAFGSASGLVFSKMNRIPTSFASPFVSVGLSVTGAPR